jgi:hypothetical protein
MKMLQLWWALHYSSLDNEKKNKVADTLLEELDFYFRYPQLRNTIEGGE